jgi:hypothetical protein
VFGRELLLAFVLGLAPGAAVGIGRFAYALVLPEMQLELGLSYAQAGLLGSANTGVISWGHSSVTACSTLWATASGSTWRSRCKR